MQRAATEASSVEEVLEVVRRDGSRITLLVNARPIRDAESTVRGAVGIAIDITKLREAEAAVAAELADMTQLHEISRRLVQANNEDALLLDIVDAAIAVTNADFGNIQLHDRRTGKLRIMASRGFEAKFLKFFDTVAESEAACGKALLERTRIVIEDVTTSPLFVGTEAFGVLLEAGVRAVQSTPLVNRAGSIVGMLSTHYQTQRRPAERDLRHLDLLARQAADFIERMQAELAIREQAERLREVDRRKDEFLAMLAHELRNPLAAVRNAVSVLKMSSEPEDISYSTDVIERQTSHLVRLIDDLLDVSRITSGKIRLKRVLCDAGSILKQAIESVEPLIRKRRHTLSSTFDEGTLALLADPNRLEQIVVNLLMNAAKYTESGGSIGLSADRSEDQIVITVRDNGVGIPPDKLPHMFELFAQGERSIARSEGGLGIGLTIVQNLVEMHGGSVSAMSAGPGRGSTFTVRLPAASLPVSVLQNQRPQAAVARRGSRILVVEDIVDTAESLARLLKLLGNEVEVALEGVTAIEAARIFKPEFVLLDIGLPGMDGYEVARTLRQEPSSKTAVIIAISGYGRDEDRRRSREAGFDHHLVKPVNFDTLISLTTVV
jgi:signal transduction histidine kinase